MMRRLFVGVLVLATLTACSPAYLRWQPEQYVVQRGDTLYSIAWRYQLDYRELAGWNGIGSNYLIYPGQVLRLTAAAAPPRSSSETAPPVRSPAATDSAPATVQLPEVGSVSWQWPVDGAVLARFEAANATGKGIDIGGSVGQEIRAAAGGKVVYSGSGLIGYGKLIIINHNGQYLSAYAHNSELYVQEGDEVRAGDRIASMGLGPGRTPMLHFEIRRNGQPVDPLRFLPRR